MAKPHAGTNVRARPSPAATSGVPKSSVSRAAVSISSARPDARAAAGKRDDVIRVAHREMELVQRHDDRLALGARQRGQRVERRDLVAGIEMRGRLVEQHQAGRLRHQRRQGDAPALPARERAHVARRELRDAEPRQRRAGALDVGG